MTTLPKGYFSISRAQVMNMWDSPNLANDQLPRLEYVPFDSLESGMKDIFNSITDSERGVGTLSNGALPGPFNAWMYTDQAMASALENVGLAIRVNTSNVPKEMKEICICVVASHYKSNVEFWAHSRIARKIGIDNHVLEDIKRGKRPDFGKSGTGPIQDLSYRFTKEYLDSHRISDEIYGEALDAIGSEKGLVEFVLVMGHYVGLAAQLNILRVPNPGENQIFEQ